jgi:hypothetical protein
MHIQTIYTKHSEDKGKVKFPHHGRENILAPGGSVAHPTTGDSSQFPAFLLNLLSSLSVEDKNSKHVFRHSSLIFLQFGLLASHLLSSHLVSLTACPLAFVFLN